jgi:hypothetical protein
MNLAKAQAAARKDPRLKAAVAVSLRKAAPGAGITDDPDVVVTLFPLVKDATAAFKAMKEELESEGLTVTYGTLARGLLILEGEGRAVSMSLTRRPAKNPSKGG